MPTLLGRDRNSSLRELLNRGGWPFWLLKVGIRIVEWF